MKVSIATAVPAEMATKVHYVVIDKSRSMNLVHGKNSWLNSGRKGQSRDHRTDCSKYDVDNSNESENLIQEQPYSMRLDVGPSKHESFTLTSDSRFGIITE